ncbi:hypothetical protein G6W47_28850 [Streptomyces sp. CAI-21]|uniref:Uncharacterized protein n=1 Tax=Streptomyces fungicidicus TaxID=68203 RepID=A0ACC7Y8S0_9ACTN|nr:hypothetical protein [Streptomyces fungicidicus]NUV78215.1 hypothetical protein [Streptomyces fungicidicus]NUW10894.1 hypothetical protein [Streptomyces sp. CAI-21]
MLALILQKPLGMSWTEAVCRTIHGAALQVGGERGSRIANRLTAALGLGSIDLSTDARV